MTAKRGWRFWIDRGGTFTDLVACDPDGGLVVRKLLSEPSERAGDPAVAAIRELLGVTPGHPLPPGAIEEIRLGTTVATNALLEGRGAPTLLLTTRGFADLLLIGDQHRPDLFALEIRRPSPLCRRVLEVTGRLGADGREIEPLRLDATLAAGLRQARAEGLRSCAVALLHAAREPRHELELAAWLEPFGFERITLSHRVGRRPRLVPRSHTAVAEACVAPALYGYLEGLRRELGEGVRLRVMQSNGGLIAPELLQAKDTILSGPAGGMVGAVRAAALEGPIIGFDMGGTSTDVFHFEPDGPGGGWERSAETEIAGIALQAPRLPIHTVAAGGGSVLHFDGQRLQVGPHSAGADPGPACYRRDGPLTITDANLLLGRLQPAFFPAVFGPRRDQRPDPEVVRRRFEQLAARVAAGSGGERNPEQLAEGALAIAVERMAETIRRITIQRGHDARRAALVSYGGAGGQHACALATVLGIRRVLLHPLAGVLSAYGMGLADQRLLRERVVREPLQEALLARLRRLVDGLTHEGEAELRAGSSPSGDLRRELSVALRYAASEVTLTLPLEPSTDAAALRLRFEREHRRRYGYLPQGAEGSPPLLVVERLQLELVSVESAVPAVLAPPAAGSAAQESVPVFLDGAWRTVPLLRREHLPAGWRGAGPALIVEATGTILLAPEWQAHCRHDGVLLLERPALPALAARAAAAGGAGSGADPVRLELFHRRFAAIAEQMGVRLQQSARSVNIRERLDFSCALFDGRGALVANAPHIPVHLGSMGASVVSLLEAVRRGERPPLRPGDAVVSNDPYNGGTHLPDLTVITPVFAAPPGSGGPGSPDFFVASRGHHADVGGITPGSMPPFSRRLEEEGLLLDNVPLLRDGVLLLQQWRERLGAGPHPVRDPDQLLADLQAQLAANRLGDRLLRDLVAREGLAVVADAMEQVQENAAEAVRRVIDRLEDGRFDLELDDGARIRVAVTIEREARRARIDFEGTSTQDEGNRNAPLAISHAVVLYVFRCLVGEAIPLNAGCFRPLQLSVPEGSLLSPRPPAAVVAGNVETSQAIANALFGALGVMAAAQGTMNNLSFGDAQRQYYETICGGSGAGRRPDGGGFAGASAVQSHMTNSRLTDPEILEERFPVRLEAFGLRRGSGGPGRWRGGDGVVRRLRFLAPMTAAILSGSRRVPPFALAGGGAGAVGRNRLERADGAVEDLGGSAQVELEPGDVLVIETPGGGGYGAP